MIIAIFGPTCSGKTTTARELAKRLGRPLRSCGDVVRDRAKMLGVSVSEVPDSAHLEIDIETNCWVKQNPTGIVEGRFLNSVLEGLADIMLVKLTADPATRAVRGIQRRPGYTLDDLLRSDREDNLFRNRMYGSIPSNCTTAIVDSSHLTVEICTQKIQHILHYREKALG